jgi:hypothetical protein
MTNAILKKETTITEKGGGMLKRAVSRKTASVTVNKPTETNKTTATVVSRQTASVVIPKKRSSSEAAVAAPLPRRTLSQSLSSTSLASRQAVPRRHAVEEPSESEVPRKKQKVEKKQDWDDLDAIDVNDPQMVSEYVNEIFDYMRELEVRIHSGCD